MAVERVPFRANAPVERVGAACFSVASTISNAWRLERPASLVEAFTRCLLLWHAIWCQRPLLGCKTRCLKWRFSGCHDQAHLRAYFLCSLCNGPLTAFPMPFSLSSVSPRCAHCGRLACRGCLGGRANINVRQLSISLCPFAGGGFWKRCGRVRSARSSEQG